MDELGTTTAGKTKDTFGWAALTFPDPGLVVKELNQARHELAKDLGNKARAKHNLLPDNQAQEIIAQEQAKSLFHLNYLSW